MTESDFALSEIQALVKRFKSLSVHERKGMNENATRQGYILPMFRALGWNIDNINEVSPEEKVSRGFVDFSFRLSGIPRYFLETKRAKEDLQDPAYVRQAIDYAWTKSVTWALLSDFTYLRVFNAEWKESNPFQAQFIEFDLESYISNFEQLWWLSRSETAAGRLNREAEKVGKKIKRLPVSQHLFDDLKLWRSELYKSLRGFNKLYSPAQIDEAVLRLINRLIFIRTTEDREVEPPRLMPMLRELQDRLQMDKLYEKLIELFRQFDATYNSELFARHFSEELYCDRPPLESLIRGLYEKNFVSYNFNAIDADVLGTAYEQYLGHIVTEVQSETTLLVESSHVEEKRTKRKSQGIYYTPTFVTQYIAKQTVSQYLDEHGYNPSCPPRILDMACGSGSFLIEAFDTLDRFVAKQRNQAYGEGDDLRDNLRRLELLQTCIFGVDKDKQAVDVARLNLMLRALHGRQKLPLLTNIYHADSLHPETWKQAFPEVMQEGGFDVIIGNPPYVRIQTLDKSEVEFFNHNFVTATGNYDIYVLFVEQALKLLKPGGVLGFILPNKFMQADYGLGLRKLLSKNKYVQRIVDFKESQIFEGATTYTCLLFLKKQESSSFVFTPAYEWLQSHSEPTKELPADLPEYQIKSNDLADKGWHFSIGLGSLLFNRLDTEFPKLGDVADIFVGLQTSADDVFIMDLVEYTKDSIRLKSKAINAVYSFERDWLFPLVSGTDVKRYSTLPERQYILFPYKITPNSYELISLDELQKDYPKTYAYLIKNRNRLEEREGGKAKNDRWYGYIYHKNMTRQSIQKLCMPRLVDKLYAAYDIDGKHFLDNVDVGGIVLKSQYQDQQLEYLLALLNAKILQWFFPFVSVPFRGGWLSANRQYVSQIPIRLIDFTNLAEKTTHDEIVKIVKEMLLLQKQHQQAVAVPDDSRYALKRRIEFLDREIDQRIYVLYGLTKEEIKIVEGK